MKNLNETLNVIKHAASIAVENVQDGFTGYNDPQYRSLQEEALYEYIALLTGGEMNLEVQSAIATIMKNVEKATSEKFTERYFED